MKVGIYCDDIKPEDGGASTLTQTILNEIKETNLCYEFVFLFPGKINGKYAKWAASRTDPQPTIFRIHENQDPESHLGGFSNLP